MTQPLGARVRPPLTSRQAERRFVLLTATRWLPVGVVFGLTVLLPLERGIPLAQVGALLAVQGFVVLGLELPTGGLADALGRRPLLVASGVLAVASTLLMVVATGFWMFAAAMLLQGVFRALDSGPLEAWYVDSAQAADPGAPIERGLGRASGVLGLAIALGASAGGGLVAWHPLDAWSALALPFVVATALYALHATLVALLVREPRRPRTLTPTSPTPTPTSPTPTSPTPTPTTPAPTPTTPAPTPPPQPPPPPPQPPPPPPPPREVTSTSKSRALDGKVTPRRRRGRGPRERPPAGCGRSRPSSRGCGCWAGRGCSGASCSSRCSGASR